MTTNRASNKGELMRVKLFTHFTFSPENDKGADAFRLAQKAPKGHPQEDDNKIRLVASCDCI